MHDHGPPPAHVRETIGLWVSDFLDRPVATEPAGRVGPHAGAVLVAFLEAACQGDRKPGDIDGHEVGHALLDHVAGLELPQTAHDAVPSLVAAFLQDLEDVGRLSGGGSLASQVRATASAYRERAARGVRVECRAAPKVGRNDPCPCGSGKKYKKCCLDVLGG
jgi:hypothetical protein